jgi:hypothetical protein
MRSITVPKLVRDAGVFLLNLLLAFLGATSFEGPLYDLPRWKEPKALLLTEYLLSAAISFALGYFVYHRWQPAPSKWLWLAGFCWFGLGAFLTLRGRSVLEGKTGGIYWGMSGIGCVYDVRSVSCANYFNYTVPSLRVVWYSAGALCRAKIATLREARSHE